MSADRFSHVLIVEDNAAELKLLCDTLQDEGFQVIGCGSAREALKHVRERDFGVAVVDYRLPDLSGTQLLEQIHTCDDHVRVIIYTGAASYDSIKEALHLGAFAYLEKLSDRGELLRHVHRACHERVGRYALDLERAVADRTEELARSNRELETFASVVAHDLRSPLLTISGYCQLLEEEFHDSLDLTAHEYLAQIVGGAERMNRLIEDLLEYSRAGRLRGPLQSVDMRSVMIQVTANLESMIQSQDARIEIGRMPTVTGDQTQLVQLFQNLLGNAIKFRREEPPLIRITATRANEAWQFAVQDNGIGIPKEYFDRVFQTFQRLQGREYPGTGIGLAICKKIVERHGGRIWLDSVDGQGTTFFFTLPDAAITRQSLEDLTSRMHADSSKFVGK
ncbi:MAG: response regulator [Pirellulales bacterium]|nr:response regulator [Pirellulales bacterium]